MEYNDVHEFRKSIFEASIEAMAYHSSDEISKEEIQFFIRFISACPLNQILHEALGHFNDLISSISSYNISND
jgi:hypothetical protein